MFSNNQKQTSLVSVLVWRIALICFVSNFILLVSLYFWLKYELSVKDQDFARARFHEVAEELQHEGLQFLNSQLEREEFNKLETLLIQVRDGQGHLLLDKKPQRMHYFSEDSLNKTLDQSYHKYGHNTVYPVRYGQETIELYSGRVKDFVLIVGVNTDSSEDFVNLFGHNALILLLITVLFIAGMSYFFVEKSLDPIRSLIKTVKGVRAGHFAPLKLSAERHDEIAELSFLFNAMLEDISHLVHSLQTSLDSIAHDLRTPMMHLKIKIEELSKRQSESPLTLEVLEDLLEETQSIEDLLSHLLELSDSASRKVSLKKSDVVVKTLIDEVIDIYEYIIEEKNIIVENFCENLILFADKGKLKRVIANLLDNAIKYSVSEKPQILFGFVKAENSVDFFIQDNGIGISPNEFHRIWERLYRVDSSRTTLGMGLGLSLVKSIVEAHGWSIRVESELGVGSKFIVSIPVPADEFH